MSDAVQQGLRGAGERARGLGKVFQGFKDFISRGNAIELAVGVVIGAAFTSVVGAIQNGLLNPVIGMLFGKATVAWKISLLNDAQIDAGLIISALIQFLLTAAAVYFLIVLPLNRLAERRKRGVEAEPARPSEDILLLQEIRDLLAAQTAAVHDVARTASAAPDDGGPTRQGRHGAGPTDPTPGA